MLVLTRHANQSIVIGHDVVVTVLEVRGDQVRLGITAPQNVQVHREEVFTALMAANKQAASSALDIEVLHQLQGEREAKSRGSAASSSAGKPAAADRDEAKKQKDDKRRF